jgi:hypothetical protein
LLELIFTQARRVIRANGHLVFSYANREREAWIGVLSALRSSGFAEKLVDLDHHGPEDKQLPPKLGHERGSQTVRPVAAIRRRDQRAGVGNDPQRAVTSSRTQRSASRPRSSGPSPEPT